MKFLIALLAAAAVASVACTIGSSCNGGCLCNSAGSCPSGCFVTHSSDDGGAFCSNGIATCGSGWSASGTQAQCPSGNLVSTAAGVCCGTPSDAGAD
jgi:hypothetical protein